MIANFGNRHGLSKTAVIVRSIQELLAAREFLGVDLGGAVSALLQRGDDDLRASAWSPDPVTWSEAAERGSF